MVWSEKAILKNWHLNSNYMEENVPVIKRTFQIEKEQTQRLRSAKPDMLMRWLRTGAEWGSCMTEGCRGCRVRLCRRQESHMAEGTFESRHVADTSVLWTSPNMKWIGFPALIPPFPREVLLSCLWWVCFLMWTQRVILAYCSINPMVSGHLRSKSKMYEGHVQLS